MRDVAPASASAPSRGATPASPTHTPPPAPARKKLSYTEQREYDTMETAITAAESAAATAEAALSNPATIADHAAMAAACQRLDAAQAEVARLYARWEELEAKRG
jgi:ATP-binding cassette subfamily F protein uup